MAQNRTPEIAQRRLSLPQWLRSGWLAVDRWLTPLPNLRGRTLRAPFMETSAERQRRNRLRQRVQIELELLGPAD